MLMISGLIALYIDILFLLNQYIDKMIFVVWKFNFFIFVVITNNLIQLEYNLDIMFIQVQFAVPNRSIEK